MKLELLKKNTILKANDKEFIFENGVCEVKKITKEIQHFIDVGYIKIKEEATNG